MALFRDLMVDTNAAQLPDVSGMLPVEPPKRTGILSALADPRVRALLAGMSQGFGQAAANPGQGRLGALATGLSGGAMGVQSWEEEQARQAAARVKALIDERRLAIEERKAEQDAARGPSFAKASGVGINPDTGEAEVYQLSDNGEQIWTGIKPAETFSYQDSGDQIVGLGNRGGFGPVVGKNVSPDALYSRDPNVLRAGAAATAEGAEQGKGAANRDAAAQSAQQVVGMLDDMQALADQGVYTGGLLDKAGRIAAGAGIPFDQGTANRTVQIRQIATNLKLMAKPPGMGAMSDAEWQILKDSIPDPDNVGDVEQLKAGIERFRRGVEAKIDAAPKKPSGAKRLRWNPQSGRLE